MDHAQSQQPIKISVILPTNAYFMSGIRDFIFSFTKNVTEFNEQWAYRFQSIADELCNNAIEYGSSSGQDIKLTIMYIPKQNIEIIVEDTGTGKQKINAEQLHRLVEEKKQPTYVQAGIRGRGLSKIVVEWTDQLEFFDRPEGGIKVRAVKNFENLSLQPEEKKSEIKAGHLILT